MTRRQRWAAGVTALVIAAVAAAGLAFRGGSTPVPVDNVIERYRKAAPPSQSVNVTPAPLPLSMTEGRHGAIQARSVPSAKVPVKVDAAAGARPLPPEGVYVYATTGGDDVDALGGSRHRYPTQTTITIRHAGCGLIERWDALQERWDERETCRSSNGDTLRSVKTYHEFFGQGDEREMACEGFAYPAAAKPGDTWRSSCRGSEGGASNQGGAIGWEDLTVDGKTVRTLHVRVTTTVAGGQTGSAVRDVWGSVNSGLVIREHNVIETDGTEPVIGNVHYHEEFDLRLKSLRPQR